MLSSGRILSMTCIIPYVLAIQTSWNSSIVSTNATVTPPDQYYLKTSVKGTGNHSKEGLYVSGYHTGLSSRLLLTLLHHSTQRSAKDTDLTSGAGTNDVTLEGIDVASVGFLNGTYQQFDYNTTFPWGLQMGDDDNYAGICLYIHCRRVIDD